MNVWLIGAASTVWAMIRQQSSRRRCFLVVAGVLVCLYACAVLGYASSVPDVGLRTAFTPIISLAYPEFLRSPEGVEPSTVEGKKIVGLADFPVDNWPQLLRVLHQLKSESLPRAVSSLPVGDDEPGSVRYQGEELVRIKLQDPSTGKESVIWCRVGHLPAVVLVPSVLWFILQVVLLVVAALLFWKRPDDESAAQFFVLSVVTVAAYMGGYHWSRIITQPVLMLIFIVSSVLLPAVGLHFYLLFPRPKVFFERFRLWVLLVIYGPPLLFLITFVFGYFGVRWLLAQELTHQERMAVLERVVEAVRVEVYVCLTVAVVWGVTSLICLVHSYVAAGDQTERNQVKWILYGLLASVAPIGYTLYLTFFQPYDFGGTGLTWPMFAASACVTVAFTVSITRYKLMQLDRVITSGAGYFLLSSLAGLVYYGVVLAGAVLASQWIAGPSLGQALGVAGAALALLLVLDWLRWRIKRALDRRFSKDKSHLDRTLQRMSQAIERLVDPPTLARRLLQESADLLRVERGAVYLRESRDVLVYHLAHHLGEAPPLTELSLGCPLVEVLKGGGTLLPRLRLGQRDPSTSEEPCQRQLRLLGGELGHGVAHEGQLLALLVFGPRASGPYRSEDVNTLAAIAQVTVLALISAEGRQAVDTLNRDLQDKVEKIAEQQRRILALQKKVGELSVEKERRHPADGGPGGERRRSSIEEESPADVERGPPPAAEKSQRPADLTRPVIGASPQVRQLLSLIKKAAESQATVLVRGESGTGKELLARALHEQSPRAGKPFVQVHCAALSAGLLESELFGHVKGAFTGAHRDKVGRFELANGGTLFLDEIGDVSLEVQTKLLRVLQERTFERVGSAESIQVDVRVAAATHQDLEQLIREGRFREDLYYRLNVISIPVPPLRDRREDIPELVQHFLARCCQRAGKRLLVMDDEALVALKGFAWPGNVRQLENAIERGVVAAEGAVITLADLPPEIELSDHEPGDDEDETDTLVEDLVETCSSAEPRGVLAERADRDRREREQLVRALAATGGNKAEAARVLGLARSTLVSRLKKHGLS